MRGARSRPRSAAEGPFGPQTPPALIRSILCSPGYRGRAVAQRLILSQMESLQSHLAGLGTPPHGDPTGPKPGSQGQPRATLSAGRSDCRRVAAIPQRAPHGRSAPRLRPNTAPAARALRAQAVAARLRRTKPGVKTVRRTERDRERRRE